MSTSQEPDVPLAVRRRRRTWHIAFMLWLCVYWSLLVVISGGSATVASKIVNDYWRDIFALIVAVCSALLATLQPQTRARSYRHAWIGLDLAIMASEQVSTNLLEALRSGEDAIGAEYQAEKTEQSKNPKPSSAER
jgi:hypothetical protein